MNLKKKEASPAQTVSVGDREMMTYMKLSVPSAMDGNANENGAPSSNADSDDLRFLDGLFERLSNDSDNGSDKGKEEGSNMTMNAIASPAGAGSGMNTNTKGAARSGVTAASSPRNLLTTLNLSTQYLQSTSASAIAAATATAITATNDAQSNPAGTLPQHLYGNDSNTTSAFLPQNLLNQHQVQARLQQHTQHHTQSHMGPSQLGALPVGVMNGIQHFNSNVNVNRWMNSTNAPGPAPGQGQGQGQGSIKPQAPTITGQFSSSLPAVPIPQFSVQAPAPYSHMRTTQTHQPIRVPDMVQSIATTATSTPATDLANGRSVKRSMPMSLPMPMHDYTSSERPLLVQSISEDESEFQKRRRDRNMREQERSQRIAKQISDLKALLTISNVPFKPDKFSTLVSVHEYIETLQQRSALLDAEQKKLVDTITKSNELVNKSQHGAHAAATSTQDLSQQQSLQVSASGHAIIAPSKSNAHPSEEDEILVFVRGLDYKSVFSNIRIALSVTSIDGRLLNCNQEFIQICNMTRETLVSSGLRLPNVGNEAEQKAAGTIPLSFFNLVAKEDMQKVFSGMGSMLKLAHPSKKENGSCTQGGVVGREANANSTFKSDHWSTGIRHCHNSVTKVSFILA